MESSSLFHHLKGGKHCPSKSDPQQVSRHSQQEQLPAAASGAGAGFRGAATSPSAASSSDDFLSSIEDRLATLGHSVSEDVIPGIEREMLKIKGWVAMVEARSHKSADAAEAGGSVGADGGGEGELTSAADLAASGGDATTERRILVAKQRLETLATALEVFKTALGQLYTPRRTGSF